MFLKKIIRLPLRYVLLIIFFQMTAANTPVISLITNLAPLDIENVTAYAVELLKQRHIEVFKPALGKTPVTHQTICVGLDKLSSLFTLIEVVRKQIIPHGSALHPVPLFVFMTNDEKIPEKDFLTFKQKADQEFLVPYVLGIEDNKKRIDRTETNVKLFGDVLAAWILGQPLPSSNFASIIFQHATHEGSDLVEELIESAHEVKDALAPYLKKLSVVQAHERDTKFAHAVHMEPEALQKALEKWAHHTVDSQSQSLLIEAVQTVIRYLQPALEEHSILPMHFALENDPNQKIFMHRADEQRVKLRILDDPEDAFILVVDDSVDIAKIMTQVQDEHPHIGLILQLTSQTKDASLSFEEFFRLNHDQPFVIKIADGAPHFNIIRSMQIFYGLTEKIRESGASLFIQKLLNNAALPVFNINGDPDYGTSALLARLSTEAAELPPHKEEPNSTIFLKKLDDSLGQLVESLRQLSKTEPKKQLGAKSAKKTYAAHYHARFVHTL